MEIEMRPDELYHYGRLGMKWGKHIFGKNKSSSKSVGKSYKMNSNKEPESDEAKTVESKQKSVKDMTDDELRRETERLNLEANYISARNRATPQSSQQSGQQQNKSLVKEAFNDAIKPAVITAGRRQLENYLNAEISKLIKPKPTEMEKLKKEAEIMGLKSKISTSKKVVDQNNKYFEEEKARKIRKEAAQKQVNDYFKNSRQSNMTNPSTYSKAAQDIVDRYTKTDQSSKLPDIRQTSTMVNRQDTSRTYSEKVYRGEKYAQDILDEYGNTIIRLDKNGKPKRLG